MKIIEIIQANVLYVVSTTQKLAVVMKMLTTLVQVYTCLSQGNSLNEQLTVSPEMYVRKEEKICT